MSKAQMDAARRGGVSWGMADDAALEEDLDNVTEGNSDCSTAFLYGVCGRKWLCRNSGKGAALAKDLDKEGNNSNMINNNACAECIAHLRSMLHGHECSLCKSTWVVTLRKQQQNCHTQVLICLMRIGQLSLFAIKIWH